MSVSLKYVKRILVIRIGSFGETLLVTPVLSALRNSLPDAYIAIMIASRKEDMVSENPNIDEVISYKKQTARFIYELRKHHFDMALILSPTFRLVLLALAAGIRYRAGFVTRSCGRLLLSECSEDNQSQHEIDRYLDVVRCIGIEPVTRDIEMSVTDDAQHWVKEFLIDSGISKERILIGIHPGGARGRRWLKERFAEVGRILADEYNAQILITAGPRETELADEVAALMQHQPVILGNTTLMRVAAAYKQCDLLISNDTGTMHTGVAVETPTIGLFGVSDPNKWGPIGPKHAIVHRNSMEAITVDDVMEVVCKKIAGLKSK